MEIAIYLEGGGDSAETKAALRLGMSTFLKPLVDMARQRHCRWSITACGGRDQAYAAFFDALEKEPEKFNVLLVDSEAPAAKLPRAHLLDRDKWHLDGAQEDQVHLMAQCMETWLVADPDALALYYDQKFNPNALPKRINLEDEPKQNIYTALENATRQTQKGEYGKIKHASELLKRISQPKVRKRCPHCERLFEVLAEVIHEART